MASFVEVAPSLRAFLEAHPKPAGVVFKYGTAGFRTKHDVLDSTFARMGCLAALRSRSCGGKRVGLMVTASHNAACDNGIKLVDPDGGMLSSSWESDAAALANAPDAESALHLLEQIAQRVDGSNLVANVIVGRDTRSHSSRLAQLALEGVSAIGGASLDMGLVTTPQLHHAVQFTNSSDEDTRRLSSESGYYVQKANAYVALLGSGGSDCATTSPKIIVDCANGVGGPKMKAFIEATLSKILHGAPVVELRNVDDDDRLNDGVGAEHVQKQRLLPKDTYTEKDRMVRLASFDGDADRIVYYYIKQDGTMRLLDGDKIASLFARFVKKQVDGLPEALRSSISMGVVQTAYANGASTRYMREALGVEPAFAKTGVKYCHHCALEFDIGIYFEANGHGTVLFNNGVVDRLKAERSSAELQKLIAFGELINQATGDAIADMLGVEAVLRLEKIDFEEWDSFYSDFPSRQLKVKVADRSIISTIPDESRTTAPPNLQPAIDELVGRFENGRAFVRPSGTEDVVRIYAEASSQVDADKLALLIAQAAYDHAGGVGERPM